MTTIAWDGKTLAGDTQSSMFRGRTRKVFRLKGGALFGMCGNLHEGIAVMRWLDGVEGAAKPTVSEGFHGILIRDRKLHVLERCLEIVEYDRVNFAIGSGRDFAMAAMHLGKNAREAVLVAHQFDVDTGDEVMSLTVPD